MEHGVCAATVSAVHSEELDNQLKLPTHILNI